MAMLEKKMELCETCGSFLISDDALERTQSHVTGKQHIGYGMVRDFLTEYKVMYQCIKRSISISLFRYVLNCLLLICRLQRKSQERKRGLLGKRKEMNGGIIGKKSMIVGARVVISEEKNLGSMTTIVIVTMKEAVEERGHMITEIEDQSTEIVPTEMGGILIEVGTNIGVVMRQTTEGE